MTLEEFRAVMKQIIVEGANAANNGRTMIFIPYRDLPLEDKKLLSREKILDMSPVIDEIYNKLIGKEY